MEQRITLYDILKIFFKRKRIVISLVILTVLLAFLNGFVLLTYEATAVVMLELKKQPTSIEPERLDIREQMAFVHSNLAMLKSRPVMLEVIKRLSLDSVKNKPYEDDIEECLKELRSDIDLESVTFTNVIKIKVKRDDAEEAADIANTLVEVYREWGKDFLMREADNVSGYLDGQIERAKERLSKSEEDLKSFKIERGVDLSSDIMLSKFESITPLYRRIANDTAVLELNNVKRVNLEREMNSRGLTLGGYEPAQFDALLAENERIALFKQGINDAEVKLAYYLKYFTTDHPSVKNVLFQEERLKEFLYDELRDLVKLDEELDEDGRDLLDRYIRLRSEIIVLEIAQETFRLVVKGDEDKKWEVRKELLPKDEIELLRMEREVKLNEVLYTELKENKDVIDLLKAVKDLGLVKIVTPATVPEKPKGRFTKFFLSNLLGFFMTVCLVMILEYRNHSYKRPREIEPSLHIPLLEVLPHASIKEKKGDFFVKRGSRTSDRFFKLAANIMPVKRGESARVVQITSALPKEGKSFVSLNLATASAELGYKVLLIDANFRQPSLHRAFDVDAKIGLVDALTGTHTPDLLILKTEYETLDLIVCGEGSTAKASIFNKKKLTAVIDAFRSKYDIIIMDTAAVNLYVDPMVISALVDSTILVIESDRTQRESVLAAKKTLEEQGKISGAVLNNMRYYIPDPIYRFLVDLHIS